MFKTVTMGCFSLILAFIIGCSGDENDIQLSSGDNLTQNHIQNAESLDKASYEGLEDVFYDTKEIKYFEGKLPIVIFGRNKCSYCERFKDDVKNNPELKAMLQEYFSPFYINLSYKKIHEFSLGKITTLRTEDLASDFFKNLHVTPTFEFYNDKGNILAEIRGYIPGDKLLKILTFLSTREWENLSLKQAQERIFTLAEYSK